MKRKCLLPLGLITFGCASFAGAVTEDLVMGVDPSSTTRAVIGSTAPVEFRLFNTTSSPIEFTLTPQGNTGAVTGPATPIAGGIGPAPLTVNHYSFLANTAGTAGTTLTTGLTATGVFPDTRTASATHGVQLLENRTINFSLTSGDKTTVDGVLDLGRFVGAHSHNYYQSSTNTYSNWLTHSNGRSVSLTMSGGAQDHNLATDVAYDPKVLSNFTYNWGRSLSDTDGNYNAWMSSYNGANQAPQTFSAPDQTTSANLNLYEQGQFSNTYQFGSASNLGTAFSAEAGVTGAAVVFGAPVTITGTSLANRLLVATSPSGGAESNRVDMDYWSYNNNNNPDPSPDALAGKLDSDSATAGIQSRVMVGSVGNIAAGNETWTIASPGGDNTFARVNFTGTGVVSNGYVSVDTGTGVTLLDGTSTRDITATRTSQSFGTAVGVDINTATAGLKSKLVSLTSNLSSGETGGALAGQNLGDLSIGYTLEVVKDRAVGVSNLHATAFTGHDITLSNGVYTVYSGTDSVTNPTAHFAPAEVGGLTSSASFSSYSNTVYDSVHVGTGSGSGTRTVSITPEGLAGERAAYDLSYNWSLDRVNAATMQEGGSLANSSNFLSVNRTNETALSASVGTFQWSQTNGNSAAQARVIEYSSSLGDGWSVPNSGLGTSSASFNFVFDDTNLNNGNYYAYYAVVAGHAQLPSGQHILNSSYDDLGYNGFWMEAVVSGREDTTAYSGFRLDNFESTAPPTVSATVGGKAGAFQILDIVDTTGTRGVSMQVLSELGSVKGPDGEEYGFVSGNIKGLDGLTFVLESTYDETEMINLFGNEELAVLLWEKSAGVFVNAVLGNYGDAEAQAIDPLTGEAYDAKLGERFVKSYADYLTDNGFTTPRLGDYGYDPDNNKVWAVIDHNSTFGGGVSAVPEPSSFLLVLSACTGFVLRRRRN